MFDTGNHGNAVKQLSKQSLIIKENKKYICKTVHLRCSISASSYSHATIHNGVNFLVQMQEILCYSKSAQAKTRPIVSNCGIASHKLTKYLAKLVSPLRKSQDIVQRTKGFINHIKKKKVPSNYKMISFEVVSLFTTSQ